MPEVKAADETAESFLSGGVDSSYVLAMSDVKMSDSCGYEEARFDESGLAKQTADILGRENSRCLITKDSDMAFIRILGPLQFVLLIGTATLPAGFCLY